MDPALSNPDYLVYRQRRKIFERLLSSLPERGLAVLDVGGRIPVYRRLLEGRFDRYVVVDPQLAGEVDTVGVGEALPFSDNSFDLVICTQVLSYVSDPQCVVDETRRVLRSRGTLFLTVPTLFPAHHDERWRFLPDGLRLLLSGFSETEIHPEGHSISGIFRTLSVGANLFFKRRLARKLIAANLIRCLNILGVALDWLSGENDQFTVNHSAIARR
jgi:SAM-dependent methyltransferase